MYAKEIPQRFERWLSNVSQTRLLALLETVCKELFPDLAVSPTELEGTYYHIWMLPVAIVALKHHLARGPVQRVELSTCGRALRISAPGQHHGEEESLRTSRKRPSTRLLLPRRALARAGFQGLLPDDLRSATRALVEAVEQRGGTVVRGTGRAACFLCDEETLVSGAAAEVVRGLLREQEV